MPDTDQSPNQPVKLEAASPTALAREAPKPSALQAPTYERGPRFWLILTALFLSLFLCALDLASVSTILPVLAHDLGSDISFIWVGSAYTLSSTAFLTSSAQLSHVLGRRPVMLACLAFFTTGSAVCGAARTMTMMVVGRSSYPGRWGWRNSFFDKRGTIRSRAIEGKGKISGHLRRLWAS